MISRSAGTSFGRQLKTDCQSDSVRHPALLPHPLLPEIETLASELATVQGVNVFAVQVHTHTCPMTVEVQIHHANEADVTLDDCARFSSAMGEALDSNALLSEAYVLEISSPGIGEQLKTDRDFLTFRGFPVKVIHRDADTTEHHLDGLLLERNDDVLQINIRGRIKRIPRDDVISVRLTTPGA